MSHLRTLREVQKKKRLPGEILEYTKKIADLRFFMIASPPLILLFRHIRYNIIIVQKGKPIGKITFIDETNQ